jgi:hypothetical protein
MLDLGRECEREREREKRRERERIGCVREKEEAPIFHGLSFYFSLYR